MRPVQYFTREYLEQCKKLSTKDILEFLEAFRLMQQLEDKTRLISIKIPETMLSAFKKKCELNNIKYQTKIKQLMKEWLESG
ncbi:MAG: BrnA antitoxin family protein [Gammaproteobacteria bacterium]|nr:BrnA antitoxin family protein [Gammaproteobacteria bacterium]